MLDMANKYQAQMRLIGWDFHESDQKNWDLPLFAEETGDKDWYYSWLLVEFNGDIKFITYKDGNVDYKTTIKFFSNAVSFKYEQTKYEWMQDNTQKPINKRSLRWWNRIHCKRKIT